MTGLLRPHACHVVTLLPMLQGGLDQGRTGTVRQLTPTSASPLPRGSLSPTTGTETRSPGKSGCEPILHP